MIIQIATQDIREQRAAMVQAYEKYVVQNMAPDREKYPKCGLRNSNDFDNHYAFYFPDSSPNEFYVDEEGALQYFVMDGRGHISRKWSATATPERTSPRYKFKLGMANNFILSLSSDIGALKNQCGLLKEDRRPMDTFFFGHSYIRLDNKGKQVCRIELGNHFDLPFTQAVKMPVSCHSGLQGKP